VVCQRTLSYHPNILSETADLPTEYPKGSPFFVNTMSEFQENNLTQTHKTDPGDSVSMVEFKNRAYNYDRLEWGKGSDSKGLLAKKCISREHPDDQSAAECRTHKDIRRSLGKYIVKNRMAYMEETEKWTAYKTRISSGDYIKRDHFGCTDNGKSKDSSMKDLADS